MGNTKSNEGHRFLNLALLTLPSSLTKTVERSRRRVSVSVRPKVSRWAELAIMKDFNECNLKVWKLEGLKLERWESES